MTVSESAVYGMYPRNIFLPEIVRTLNGAGFENKDICMVLSPAHPVATVLRDARIVDSNLEESAASARMIGWFSEFGAVVIPTFGFFIRSHAFFQALIIEQNSPLCGGSKTLADLGFSQEDAARLGRQLCDVGVLVYVACSERARADWAVELLRHTGAGEAASLEAQGTPLPENKTPTGCGKAASWKSPKPDSPISLGNSAKDAGSRPSHSPDCGWSFLSKAVRSCTPCARVDGQ